MNLALIKHDGTALNLPASAIQGIIPAIPTEEAPDLNSVIISSFRGGATFYLQDNANSVFEALEAQSKNADVWAKLDHTIEGEKLFLHSKLIEGYDGVKSEAFEAYRVWINNQAGMEFFEFCKLTENNKIALDFAINSKDGKNVP